MLTDSEVWLTFEISALETLHSSQFTLSSQLIEPNYLVLSPPHPAMQHHSLFKNLTPLLYSCQPSEIQFAKLCLMMELTTGKNFCQNANISLALQVRIPD